MAKLAAKRPRPSASKAGSAGKVQDHVYRELLTDAAASGEIAESRIPLKRRKIKAEGTSVESFIGQKERVSSETNNQRSRHKDSPVKYNTEVEPHEEEAAHQVNQLRPSSSAAAQTIYDGSESSTEESDIDWENELNIQNAAAQDFDSGMDQKAGEDIQIDLEQEEDTKHSKRNVSQRLSSSRIEKRKRLDVHKLHVLAMLAQLYIRNDRCNDSRIHEILGHHLDDRIKRLLKPKSSLSQHDRTKQFIKGLEDASHAWRAKFVLTSRGVVKPEWPTSSVELNEIKFDEDVADNRINFMRAAAKPSGSRDLGAQLFCALLRSVGVDARLVCSLQPLSFNTVAPIIKPPPYKPTVDLSSSATQAVNDSDSEEQSSERNGSPTPRPIRRFGRAPAGLEATPDLGKAPPSASKRRRIVDSPYPVFWIEAFNTAKQQWTPVDAFATRAVNKPAKFEPPASDPFNAMSYVIAFNIDGTARDVTRRYTKAYNAKTRQSRVETTEDGARWMRKALKVFKCPEGKEDRDAFEDAELDNLEAKEPMPRNVQDFKRHPYYALERHLRRHEVIYPKHEVGKLRVGKGEDAVESVYRRRNVQACKTADKWYRLGRELKQGEQPLKRVKQKRKPGVSMSPEAFEDKQVGDTVGLYGPSQTELYIPPPCTNGKVPKNQYKNLDVYIPSMIPPGTVHVRSSDGVMAARILRVDYAEAVTGFQFKGRRGTPIMRGVVVPQENREAIEEVVEALRFQRRAEDIAKRSQLALSMWKKFMVGLRIRERIMTQNDIEAKEEVESGTSGSEYEDDNESLEGGFMAGEVVEPIAHPQRGIDPDLIKDKFQDSFAEVINDDPGKRSKEYWESTIVSPWDVPGLLRPIREPNVPVDHLFEEPQESGGFMQDEMRADRISVGPEAGEFLPSASSEAQVQDLNGGNVARGPSPQYDTDCKSPEKAPTSSSGDKRETDELAKSLHEVDEHIQQSKNQVNDEEESLLSEDPEDADAEPDWLVDAVGF